jgi:hypothetical protein
MEWTAKSDRAADDQGQRGQRAVIAVTGITGRIRGMKFKRPDGKSVRPDLIIPTTRRRDESAKSPSQCDERRILSGACWAWPGRRRRSAA